MSEREPPTALFVSTPASAETAIYSPDAAPSPEQLAATAAFESKPTSGPDNALRETLAVDAPPAPQYPVLPDLIVEAYLDGGGMGRVYRAKQKALNRTVAVKIITATGRDGLIPRERFQREVESLAQIEHPNIVPIYSAGEWHGFPYFTMKYIAGGALAAHLPRLAGQTTAVVRLMLKVARGLQALHERGIVHRDLKPLNILLDDGDEPVIADFGLAKWMDDVSSSISVPYAAIGTKFYMSPEQSLGLKTVYGPATDIWSFGVTLHELLTGTRPFRDDLKGDVFEQIRSVDPEVPASIPPDLATVLRRCLQKQPQDRYASAGDLADDLERWLAGRPVTAPVALRKPAATRRRRVWTAVAGLTLGLFVVAPIVAAVWPREPKPEAKTDSKKSAAERLKSGEAVTLIGAKGLPEDLGQPFPDSTAQFATDPVTGCCLLGSPGIGAMLLLDEAIEDPVEITCDVALLSARQPSGYAGLIFGSRTVKEPGQPPNSALQFVLHLRDEFGPQKGEFAIETGTVDWLRWGNRNRSPGNRSQIVAAERKVPVSKPESPTIEWRSLRVRLGDGVAFASWDDRILTPIPSGEAERLFPQNPGPEPKFGRGIGLTAFNTNALFRNLIITPIHPDAR